MLELSAREARALAITAQGLADPRRAHVDRAALLSLIERLGVVQIDSVNVLARSHYLPAWSRLGAYDPAELDRLAHEAPRSVFEYWGHEASLLPVALHPVLRWRMARARHDAWTRIRTMGTRRRAFVDKVLAAVAEHGPVRVADLADKVEGKQRRAPGWWAWSDVKIAIEWLFWSGQVTAAARRAFERLYDLPARVLPADVIDAPTPDEPAAHRALIERAARALGVATESDLRDYYRQKPAPARPAIAALVEAGALVPARVEGWTKPAYVHRDATAMAIDPARAALVSPFDSLVWFRERTERMFGMRYRIEIYTPEPQRVHGYYVLPFLLGDALVARVDLKADRARRVLRVQAAHREPGAPPETAVALAAELAAMAAWLGLDEVTVGRRGNLARELAATVARPRRKRADGAVRG
ncbi:MAG TPA: crosslink repair DNA glycosylase YcaQ family protein [Kofleriaceae bacterium]|nr:crosslink repair DNA glycosylase YcaQ family protein [Kofleriaceae bacterium]